MSEKTVALWYWRHYSLHYSLYDDEQKAAYSALYLEDSGEGLVEGIQFSDGRTLSRPTPWKSSLDWWPAYKAEYDRQRIHEEQTDAKRHAEPPRPTRVICAPFGLSELLNVDASEPEWLGVPEVVRVGGPSGPRSRPDAPPRPA